MPRQFRGYTVIRPLGMGGMASIYLGVQENLQRQVAIKLLDKRLALNDDFVRRFEREARAASELNHRNIITIHEFGNEEDDYYIVMEFVDGTDLRDVMIKVPVFPPEVALVVLEEITSGLAAAHEKDIVHRDIKPANVLLSGSGDVKVTDFGLARDFGMDTSRLFDSLTVEGTVLGTPSYMSPEQASSLPVNDRTDVFSLGVMAWEMFTGVKPFTGESYSEVRSSILQGSLPRLDMERPLAVPQIEDMLRRMLTKEPAQRPSMKQLLHHVESCMEALDPSGTLLRYRRRFLEKFAAEPEAFATKLERNAVRTSLDRGIYAKALGIERLDQAIEHLEFVTKRDPENSRAQEALEDIQRVASGAKIPAPSPREAATEVTPTGEQPSAIQRKKARGAGPLGATALIVLALVLSAVALEMRWVPGLETFDLSGTLSRYGLGGLTEEIQEFVPPTENPAPVVAVVDSSKVEVPTPAPTSGQLWLVTEPAGARVDLRAKDEEAFRSLEGETPIRTDALAFGEYELRFRRKGRESRSETVKVTQAGIDTVSVKLPAPVVAVETKKPAPKPPPKAKPEPKPVVAKATPKDETVPKKKTVEPVAPPPPTEAWVTLRTEPKGNYFLNGSLVAAKTGAAILKVPADEPMTLEVRHPEVFGSRMWTRRIAGGDTLDLGTYRLSTGTVRVTTRPHAPVGVLIDGRATRKETPLALTVASRQQLVSMNEPGWLVEKVVVTDRTAGSPPREIVPANPADFPGVVVDVVNGHDLKVVFHLVRAD